MAKLKDQHMFTAKFKPGETFVPIFSRTAGTLIRCETCKGKKKMALKDAPKLKVKCPTCEGQGTIINSKQVIWRPGPRMMVKAISYDIGPHGTQLYYVCTISPYAITKENQFNGGTCISERNMFKTAKTASNQVKARNKREEEKWKCNEQQ